MNSSFTKWWNSCQTFHQSFLANAKKVHKDNNIPYQSPDLKAVILNSKAVQDRPDFLALRIGSIARNKESIISVTCNSSFVLTLNHLSEKIDAHNEETKENFRTLLWRYKFWNLLRNNGIHELVLNEEQAQALANTRVTFDVPEFKSGYNTMVVYMPPKMIEHYRSQKYNFPDFALCYHNPEHNLLIIQLFSDMPKNEFVQLTLSLYSKEFSGFDTIEDKLQSDVKRIIQTDSDEEIQGDLAAYRIAINSLMVSTSKDWMAPMPTKQADDFRKFRAQIKSSVINTPYANIPISHNVISLNLKTLTPPSNSTTNNPTNKKMRYHTREAHWQRIHFGPNKSQTRWQYIASCEVNPQFKPQNIIHITNHKLNHPV